MKHVIRMSKAIPWALLGRLGVKTMFLLGAVLMALLVFCGKAVALYFKLLSMDKDKPNPDEKLFDVGSYPSRPDLDPFRP